MSGAPFNDAYRYVGWLLTVPLLLIELNLVMKLPSSQTVGRRDAKLSKLLDVYYYRWSSQHIKHLRWLSC